MTFHLQRHESLDDGFRRIAREQIDFALRDLADAADVTDRTVHSLRKRCKKLRGLLRLVRPLMGAEFDVEDDRFRDAARLLAQSRDRRVRATVLDAFDAADGGAGPAQAVLSTEDVRELRTRFVAAREAVATWPVALHGFADIAPGLAQTYRHGVEAWQAVRGAPDDGRYHQLRKWAKYHWYHVRVLERINRPMLGKRRERLRKLQLVLGDAHDLALVLQQRAADALPDDALPDQLDARKRRLYRHADRRAATLFRASPDEMVADFAGWWVGRH